ncbi:MAG: hypothetical protein O9341_19190 [Paucibacter sp.]|nr:hypothetical protein [Roseateles sp.]
MLLDSAASQIRDAPLLPVRENIHKIGTSLAELFEIQQAIYRAAPELNLERKYETPPPEVSEANRRLGQAMLAADDLSEAERHEEAVALLVRFAEEDPSEFHRSLAAIEAERYRQRREQ